MLHLWNRSNNIQPLFDPWTLDSKLAIILTEVCSLNLEASQSLCILHNVLLSIAFHNLNELSGHSFHSFLFLIWFCVVMLDLLSPKMQCQFNNILSISLFKEMNKGYNIFRKLCNFYIWIIFSVKWISKKSILIRLKKPVLRS